MYQIVKIFRVPPHALTRIHKALESGVMKSKTTIIREGGSSEEKPNFALLLSARYDKETEGYVVEIQIPIITSGKIVDGVRTKDAILFTPMGVMKEIYAALEVFPEEEKLARVYPTE